MSEELLNTKYKDKLEPSYKVLIFTLLFFIIVFAIFSPYRSQNMQCAVYICLAA